MMWFKAQWPMVLLWSGLIFILLQLYVSGRLIRLADHASDRSLHQGEVLTGGGFLMFLPIAFIMIYYGWYLPAVLMVLLTVVGVLDDILSLSARLRLVIQLSVVLITLWYLGFDLALWSLFLCVAFLWWLNLFNFMDGANGLVTMHAIITLGFPLLTNALPTALNPLVIFVIMALIIYLYFNVGLKRLFMGDSGSLPLAFLIGLIALVMINNGTYNVLQVALMHAVLIIDSSLTLVVRLFRGEHIAEAHRSHLYQRLIGHKSVHWPVSAAYAMVTAVCCAIAVMISDSSVTNQVSWFVGVIGVLVAVFIHCRHVDR